MLQKHIRRHKRAIKLNKPFKPNKEKKCISREENVNEGKEHLNIILMKNEFSTCSACNKVFNSRSNLLKHMEVHVSFFFYYVVFSKLCTFTIL